MPVESASARAGGILEPPRRQSLALARLPGIRHGFFGREGGVSEGVYASLNAGPGSRDDQGAIAENRRRIAAAMGAAPDRLLSLHQVHSAIAVRVSGPWTATRPEADGLVAAERGLALTALAADCAPVLFADADAGVIAAAHAGWRGALGGVLEATIARMEEAGAQRARIVAAIGPCIAQRSYEVGPEFETAFLEQDPDYAAFFTPGASDRRQFDLPGFAAHRLRRLGLAHVEALGIDTYDETNACFSHRRGVHRGEADYGRNCSAIMLTS